jgi:uncharacterized protein (DUF433 family)
MKAEKLLDRITLDSNVMAGKPVIRGTRLTVQFILGLLAHGASVEELLSEYKGLTMEDIQACLFFATVSLRKSSVHCFDLRKGDYTKERTQWLSQNLDEIYKEIKE